MRYDTPPPSSVAMLEKSCQNLIRRVYDSTVMRLHLSYCMEVTVHSNCHSVRTDTMLNRYLRIPSVLFASLAGLFCVLGFATSSTNPSPLALVSFWLRNGQNKLYSVIMPLHNQEVCQTKRTDSVSALVIYGG